MSNELARPPGREAAIAERRDAQRYAFICPAEFMDLQGIARFSARTLDLSVRGCYIDTMNPFPVGTQVRVQLTKNDQRLELLARVISCHMGAGMGLIFEETTHEQNSALLAWLEGPPAQEESPFPTAPSEADVESAPQGHARFAAKLVKILERKGILTHSEASELLRGLDS